jgi:hypothetical protein
VAAAALDSARSLRRSPSSGGLRISDASVERQQSRRMPPKQKSKHVALSAIVMLCFGAAVFIFKYHSQPGGQFYGVAGLGAVGGAPGAGQAALTASGAGVAIDSRLPPAEISQQLTPGSSGRGPFDLAKYPGFCRKMRVGGGTAPVACRCLVVVGGETGGRGRGRAHSWVGCAGSSWPPGPSLGMLPGRGVRCAAGASPAGSALPVAPWR